MSTPSWIEESNLCNDLKKIGNTSVKTDQDTLKNVVTLRASDNHKAMALEKMDKLNENQLKKIKIADVWRMAIESFCK